MIPPYKGPAKNKQVNIELGNDPNYQLFNLAEDLAQQTNLAESHPGKLTEMKERYAAIKGSYNAEIEQLELK